MRTTATHYLKYPFLVCLIAAILTIGSCLIVTGKAYTDVSSTKSITGEYLVALSCTGYPGSLHDARGIPKDIIYYTRCGGTKILRDPLLINYVFWLGVTLISTILYKIIAPPR